ncbi:cyclin-like protein [Entophlyctis helioformis]|nr:cyclin-like protein [Entophlyctis helioformis]
MSANLWDSTQACQWLLDRQTLAALRTRDLERFSHDEFVLLTLHYANIIQRVCRRLQVRQHVVGTALLYWRRFFTKNALMDIDPYLVAGTAVYVACKIEECPHHIKNVVNEMRNCLGAEAFPYEAASIADFEYYLLEELEFSLVVFHPYRSIQQFLARLGLVKPCLQTAWYIANDAYRTDLLLLYPPYMIALAAVYMATCITDFSGNGSASQGQGAVSSAAAQPLGSSQFAEVRAFFSSLNVDMRDILAITQDIFSLYRVWETYTDNGIAGILDRLGVPSAPAAKA